MIAAMAGLKGELTDAPFHEEFDQAIRQLAEALSVRTASDAPHRTGLGLPRGAAPKG